MNRHLPNLGGLKTFEAAARHLSFTKAGQELGVTPAAVSYQIRELEAQLGVSLFLRSTRAMQLTDAGHLLGGAMTAAFDGIAQTVARLKEMKGRPRLTVATGPSFAAKWLVPRLHRFLQQNPAADVRVEVTQEIVELGRTGVDIAVRFGHGNYPGMRVDRLFDEVISPVCSPRLAAGDPPLRHPGDLSHHTLIHVDWQTQGATWPDWRMWMRAAGIDSDEPLRGLHFSQTSLAVQAAVDGQGVALSESTLVADDIAAGRLVHPFHVSIRGPAALAYYLVSPPAGAAGSLIGAFRDWIIAEARQMPAPA
jgi:LysR family transcriptional regulator, glycine cleavage system transcriptional activator